MFVELLHRISKGFFRELESFILELEGFFRELEGSVTELNAASSKQKSSYKEWVGLHVCMFSNHFWRLVWVFWSS